ncbi:Tau-tubulin kinase 2 [Entophlyctis luteolus]|nr:Tau-tubulin kinase 2 [Entophlyctis luteolus]KAJ3391124.1 Tau-tubulin kinase 2 [Entophlyctis sp. JEL0112]
MGMELSRVDDLWSLFYLLVEFLVGTLPWKGKEKEVIGDIKVSHTNSNLVLGLPPSMLVFMELLFNTSYEAIPRYDVIDDCLIALGRTVTAEDVWDENGNAIALYDWEFKGFGEGETDIALLRDNDVRISRVLDEVEARRRRVGGLLDSRELFESAETAEDENAEIPPYDEGFTSLANGTIAEPFTSSTGASSSVNTASGMIGPGIYHSPHRRFSDISASSIPNTNYGSPSGAGLPRWERQNSLGSVGAVQIQAQSNETLGNRRASQIISGLTLGLERIGLNGSADDNGNGKMVITSFILTI